VRVWEILEFLVGVVNVKRDGRFLGVYDLDVHEEYDFVLTTYYEEIVEEIFADEDELVMVLRSHLV
jgi:hypothetical protein